MASATRYSRGSEDEDETICDNDLVKVGLDELRITISYSTGMASSQYESKIYLCGGYHRGGNRFI